ncbi:Murein L,D-transpeptidase YcbB/YkuD [Meinhardsimonia xiamenensis]|uniref:Murein L,D-transpeptidase YcbB/YkuD n=1 Tax=Meinhardsimonia xiamenensis TaxID=990712 RepID=A0A1G9GBK9_9RHOB|nr:L,D-transpeptidase family protein [Meinhardsimonia xiamenensis]PRX31974.1 murein L,D-transpeptidase YcbB/YkuD [Meinhardsimonia xiamenensis]SDK98114.1 Murein L,D-transpeptidase YcbB/YkuD [Meinhardsimonia xiamenensis]
MTARRALGAWAAIRSGALGALATLATAATGLSLPSAAAASAGVSAELAARLTPFMIAVAETAAQDREIAAFYRANGYRPIWTGGDEDDRRRLEALLSAIARAEDHALPRARFEQALRRAGLDRIATQREMGRAEVALSRIFLDYAKAVHSGLLTPSAIDPGIERKPPELDRRALLERVAAADDPAPLLRSLAPRSPEYARLMRAKRELEAQLARGGWGPRVPASSLRPGDQGAAVVALRDRLVAMGYMERSLSAVYDGKLQQAVQAFQLDHGLPADGIAGGATIREINRDIEDRLRSVYVAMERERWLNVDRGARHIWVNIPDFVVRIIDNGKVTFETRSVVGKNTSDRRTPEFSDVMEYMEINPNWNVPRSIAVKEYLPSIIASGGAAARHLQLIDSRGNVVSRAAVDYARYSPSNFPYDLRQPPGDGNALGLVKFMFPNPHNIYLHDTPAKSLFERDRRDFSHGCIRLHKPFEFAYALLARQVSDPVRYFHERLESGRLTRVDLEQPVPVHIVYRTAYTSARGKLIFRDDVYGRDAKVFAALEAQGVRVPRPGS